MNGQSWMDTVPGNNKGCHFQFLLFVSSASASENISIQTTFNFLQIFLYQFLSHSFTRIIFNISQCCRQSLQRFPRLQHYRHVRVFYWSTQLITNKLTGYSLNCITSLHIMHSSTELLPKPDSNKVAGKGRIVAQRETRLWDSNVQKVTSPYSSYTPLLRACIHVVNKYKEFIFVKI